MLHILENGDEKDILRRQPHPVGLQRRHRCRPVPAPALRTGIAATLGLLDDWVLIGCGANLQTEENRWSGFFSLRLFETPGGLGE